MPNCLILQQEGCTNITSFQALAAQLYLTAMEFLEVVRNQQRKVFSTNQTMPLCRYLVGTGQRQDLNLQLYLGHHSQYLKKNSRSYDSGKTVMQKIKNEVQIRKEPRR